MASISIETKKISELDVASEASGDDLLLLHRADGTGTKAVKASVLKEFAQEPDYNNAGAHNSLFRGKNLGTSVTDAQWAAIKAGTFDDLWIGDYWVINNVTWRIAAFDYYYRSGDTTCTDHHAVIVPDTKLYEAKMVDSLPITGGYANCKMRTTYLDPAKTTIKAAFAGHVLKHRVFLVNAIANNAPSGTAWYDSEVELMTEQMVYGSLLFAKISNNNNKIETSQLPLFALRHDLIAGNHVHYWLRDIADANYFIAMAGENMPAVFDANNGTLGVRPSFCIY